MKFGYFKVEFRLFSQIRTFLARITLGQGRCAVSIFQFILQAARIIL